MVDMEKYHALIIDVQWNGEGKPTNSYLNAPGEYVAFKHAKLYFTHTLWVRPNGVSTFYRLNILAYGEVRAKSKIISTCSIDDGIVPSRFMGFPNQQLNTSRPHHGSIVLIRYDAYYKISRMTSNEFHYI